MPDRLHQDGADTAVKPPALSVHVLLPEGLDRRLERRTDNMLGASWPGWGGHITLVPSFLPLANIEEIRQIIENVTGTVAPLTLHFAEPVAVPDVTRPGYFAVLLKVEEQDAQAASSAQAVSDEVVEADDVPLPTRLTQLRQQLLDALRPMRQDLRPQLVEQRFAPHVTLALGLGEIEARTLVRHLRAEPITAEFTVDTIWLLTHIAGEQARVDRQAIPLGRVATSKDPSR